MQEQQLTKLSRFLSYVLRHKPEALDLTMAIDGWVLVEELIAKLNATGTHVTRDILDTIVTSDNKQRYSYNSDKTKIRANQGHSIKIDLGLEPINPPDHLYHGTAERNLESIKAHGLTKQSRHHVHLSENETTARQVGSRYGKPVILVIAANEMKKDGYIFYRSENNVWLTEMVPIKYISFPS